MCKADTYRDRELRTSLSRCSVVEGGKICRLLWLAIQKLQRDPCTRTRDTPVVGALYHCLKLLGSATFSTYV